MQLGLQGTGDDAQIANQKPIHRTGDAAREARDVEIVDGLLRARR